MTWWETIPNEDWGMGFVSTDLNIALYLLGQRNNSLFSPEVSCMVPSEILDENLKSRTKSFG